eukprot:gb/GFBE01020715.1/.p1 GENE.gb/GFBE01020715.1/~~gb/GFBE01020715.1/.p1  ORF type:complete len:846 (+),score=96.42 gb/GFBE01020715.1/:1-2538(+)
MVSVPRPGSRGGRRPLTGGLARPGGVEGPKAVQRPSAERDPGANAASKTPPTAVWVGADAVKVLAGPALACLTYTPPEEDELGVDPVQVAEHRAANLQHVNHAEEGGKDEAVRAHEYRAAVLLRQRQPVAALAELEAALCLCEKRGLESAVEVRRRWQTLAASAVAWSLDFLADAGLAAEKKAGSCLAASDQALEMLCLAEMLTRQEVAATFGAQSLPSRPFLRALAHAGLGSYYQLRGKPRAALRFLEQAASGHARWAHPAVLLNLCAAHALLKEPGPALAALGQAVLALRSATGRLCGEGMDEVDAAATAARAAVTAVLGPAFVDEDTDGPSATAMLELDPFGHGMDFGEDQSGRVVPGDILETPQATRSSFGGPSIHQRKADHEQKAPRRGLGRHGLISKTHTPRGQDIYEYEVEAAVARTLLVAKVLLWPWPEFQEQEALASGVLAASTSSQAEAPTGDDEQGDLKAHLSKMAAPGIAQHAAKLKKAWPQWGKPLQSNEVPGGGLVMRECLLLCFLHAASALALLCSEAAYSLWVVPPLREGLALAIVLFGPKHPLALKLINACQRVQRSQGMDPQPPSSPSKPKRRSGVQVAGLGKGEESSKAGRVRPPSSGRGTPSSGRGRARVPMPPAAAKGDRSGGGKSRPGSRASSPPPWNAGAGSPQAKKDSVPSTPRGRLPKALEVPEGMSKGLLHMQLQSPRASHGRERQRPIPPVLSARPHSSERELRHLRSQAVAETRRELRELSRPSSAALPLAGGGLGRRLRARTSMAGRPGGPPAAVSLPSTPRSVSPNPCGGEGRSRSASREPIWQQASRQRAARPSSGRLAANDSLRAVNKRLEKV